MAKKKLKKFYDGGEQDPNAPVQPNINYFNPLTNPIPNLLTKTPLQLHQEIYSKANYVPHVPTNEELWSKMSGRLEPSPIQPEDILQLGLSVKNLFNANKLFNAANKPIIVKGINIGSRPKSIAKAQELVNRAQGQAAATVTVNALDYSQGGSNQTNNSENLNNNTMNDLAQQVQQMMQQGATKGQVAQQLMAAVQQGQVDQESVMQIFQQLGITEQDLAQEPTPQQQVMNYGGRMMFAEGGDGEPVKPKGESVYSSMEPGFEGNRNTINLSGTYKNTIDPATLNALKEQDAKLALSRIMGAQGNLTLGLTGDLKYNNAPQPINENASQIDPSMLRKNPNVTGNVGASATYNIKNGNWTGGFGYDPVSKTTTGNIGFVKSWANGGNLNYNNTYDEGGQKTIPYVRVMNKFKDTINETYSNNKSNINNFTEDFGRQIGSNDNSYSYQREGTDKPYLNYFSYNDTDGKSDQMQIGSETYMRNIDPRISKYLRTKIDSETNNMNNQSNYAHGGKFAEGGQPSPEEMAMMEQQAMQQQAAPQQGQPQQGGQDPMAQVMQMVQQMVQQGAKPMDVIVELLNQQVPPEAVAQVLVQMGMPQDQVVAAIQQVMQQGQQNGGEPQMQSEEEEQAEGQASNPLEESAEIPDEGEHTMMKFGGQAKKLLKKAYGGKMSSKGTTTDVYRDPMDFVKDRQTNFSNAVKFNTFNTTAQNAIDQNMQAQFPSLKNGGKLAKFDITGEVKPETTTKKITYKDPRTGTTKEVTQEDIDALVALNQSTNMFPTAFGSNPMLQKYMQEFANNPMAINKYLNDPKVINNKLPQGFGLITGMSGKFEGKDWRVTGEEPIYKKRGFIGRAFGRDPEIIGQRRYVDWGVLPDTSSQTIGTGHDYITLDEKKESTVPSTNKVKTLTDSEFDPVYYKPSDAPAAPVSTTPVTTEKFGGPTSYDIENALNVLRMAYGGFVPKASTGMGMNEKTGIMDDKSSFQDAVNGKEKKKSNGFMNFINNNYDKSTLAGQWADTIQNPSGNTYASTINNTADSFTQFLNNRPDENRNRANQSSVNTKIQYGSDEGIYDQFGKFKPDTLGAEVLNPTDVNYNLSSPQIFGYGGNKSFVVNGKKYEIGGEVELTDDELKNLKKLGYIVTKK